MALQRPRHGEERRGPAKVCNGLDRVVHCHSSGRTCAHGRCMVHKGGLGAGQPQVAMMGRQGRVGEPPIAMMRRRRRGSGGGRRRWARGAEVAGLLHLNSLTRDSTPLRASQGGLKGPVQRLERGHFTKSAPIAGQSPGPNVDPQNAWMMPRATLARRRAGKKKLGFPLPGCRSFPHWPIHALTQLSHAQILALERFGSAPAELPSAPFCPAL